jgi:hypothetical protein
MITITEKSKEEVFKAREKVLAAQRELNRAEVELNAVLEKYWLKDSEEEDISKYLPTLLYFKGFRLFALGNTVTLRKQKEDFKTWNNLPSLSDLFEVNINV